MKQLTRRTTVLLAAAALLASALIPLAVFAQEKTQPATPAQPRMDRPRPLADLNLTPDQVKALQAFRQARQEQAKAFRNDMAKLRDEMRGLRADPDANKAKIEALIDKQAALMAAHEKDLFRARAERNKIFTPEQLQKLKAMRTRLADRGGMGRVWMGQAWGGRGFGGGFFGPRAGLRPFWGWRALRHRLALRWWLW